MKSWFVPPIVIPVLIVVSLVGYVSLQTISLKISELRDAWRF
jgi:hypothetical protein